MTDERAASWADQEQRYGRSPIHATLGLTLDVLETGKVTIHHNGCPEGANSRGNPSGGLLAQMIDSAVMQSVLTHLASGDHATTLELKVNYVRAADAGQGLKSHGHLEFIGRTTAVGIGRVEDGTGRLLALGTVTAAIRRREL
ncbi:MAG: thioesterase [Ramlibacter sp.]|nr:thioesterase [Ramlibacter sp.]